MAAVDAQRVATNKIINLIDPPKDLMIGGHLKEATHGAKLKDFLADLFLGSGEKGTAIPTFLKVPAGKYSAVGDKKEFIQTKVDAAYTLTDNRILKIVREKHSTGHNARPDMPSGYYLAQDCGTMAVVINPKIIHTPGSILDPAGKTKTGSTMLIGGTYNTLPLDNNIRNLGLDTCITGDITVSETSAKYTITIPTRYGTVVGEFNTTTFKPEGASAVYFEGNDTKNKFIKDTISTISEENNIKLMILMKELGDTLQVEWLNRIFEVDNGSKPYKRENVLIATQDSVVMYRSIVNNVGVVFTKGADTTIYLPADAAAESLIKKNYINTVRVELLSANQSIIQTITDAMNSIKTGKLWINGISWEPVQYTNAKKFLEAVITQLTAINTNLNERLIRVIDLNGAKDIAAKNRFQAPFVYYKNGGYYKTINSVIRPFLVNKFKPSNFGSEQTATTMGLITGMVGGNRKKRGQIGGALTTAEISADIPFQTLISTKVCEETATRTNPDREITTRSKYFIENTDTIFLKNLNAFQSNEIELFLYVRDFFPEVFVYGEYMALAMVTKSPKEEENNKLYYKQNENDYFPNGTYYWSEDDGALKYVGENSIDLPNEADRNYAKGYVKHYLKYAYLFCVDCFPQLLTNELKGFLDKATSVEPKLFNKLDASSTANLAAMAPSEEGIQRVSIGGGGGLTNEEWNMYLNIVSTIAMDLYEQYYYLRMKSAYEDKDTIDGYIEERQILLDHYYTALSEEENPILRYELQIIEQDYRRITNKPYKYNSYNTSSVYNTTNAIHSIPKMVSAYGGKRKTLKKRKRTTRSTRNRRR